MTNLVVFFWSFFPAVATSIEKEDVEALIKANNDNLLVSFKGLLEQTVSRIKWSNEESAESQMKETKRLKFNESLKKTKWPEDRHNSGVVLSSVNIEASSLPSQSELGSAIDSDPSVAACADSFLLDSFGFRLSCSWFDLFFCAWRA